MEIGKIWKIADLTDVVAVVAVAAEGVAIDNDDLGYSLIQLMTLTHSRNIFSNTM